MIRIKLFNRNNDMIDEVRLFDDAWSVLMPKSLGAVIAELSAKHSGIWTRFTIEVL